MKIVGIICHVRDQGRVATPCIKCGTLTQTWLEDFVPSPFGQEDVDAIAVQQAQGTFNGNLNVGLCQNHAGIGLLIFAGDITGVAITQMIPASTLPLTVVVIVDTVTHRHNLGILMESANNKHIYDLIQQSALDGIGG